jgi:hypothetical protein
MWWYSVSELRQLTGPSSIPQMIQERMWSIGGIMLTGVITGLGENSVPVPFCLPQIQHWLPWKWARAAAVRSWRLTALQRVALLHRALIGCPVAQSVVSDYELDKAIEVRFPARAGNCSSGLGVHTGSGAHPASCTMGTGVLSPGLKRSSGVTLTTHSHLVPRSRVRRSYMSSIPKRLHGM